MARRFNLLKTLRLIHLYLGVFTAPAILFFAFTGALQTFSLNDSSRDGSYKPPAWVSVLAQLHKKQTTQLPVRRPQPPPPVPASAASAAPASAASAAPGEAAKAERQEKRDGAAEHPDRPTRHPLPMKIFFLIVCIGLFASTLTGLYMSWKYNRKLVLLSAIFLAGIALPVLLTLV